MSVINNNLKNCTSPYFQKKNRGKIENEKLMKLGDENWEKIKITLKFNEVCGCKIQQQQNLIIFNIKKEKTQ
jgi:hypothetical protein